MWKCWHRCGRHRLCVGVYVLAVVVPTELERICGQACPISAFCDAAADLHFEEYAHNAS